MKTMNLKMTGMVLLSWIAMTGYSQNDNRPARQGTYCQERFDQYDADQDGKVSYDEMRDYMKDDFETADQDEDGQLDLQEFIAFGPRHSRRGFRSSGELMKDLDLDNNGQITADEVCGPMRKRLHKLDANQDGSVDLDEFQNRRRGRGCRRGKGF